MLEMSMYVDGESIALFKITKWNQAYKYQCHKKSPYYFFISTSLSFFTNVPNHVYVIKREQIANTSYSPSREGRFRRHQIQQSITLNKNKKMTYS